MKLDDPAAARPLECICGTRGKAPCPWCRAVGFTQIPTETPFKYDDEALWYVMMKAAEGSKYHRKAIALAAGITK